jgi:hypothetical protein
MYGMEQSFYLMRKYLKSMLSWKGLVTSSPMRFHVVLVNPIAGLFNFAEYNV